MPQLVNLPCRHFSCWVLCLPLCSISPCRWVTEEVSSKTHKVKLALHEAVIDIDLIRGAEKAPVLKQFLASQLNKWKI